MRVALINPTNEGMYPGSPPLSLAILAAYLRQFGHLMKIIDMASGTDYKRDLIIFKPEVVGITATSSVILEAYAIADYCKKCGYKVIMGGAHVSVMPNEAIEHCDAVVIGEGETALQRVVDNDDLKGIIAGEPVMDLDEIPMPAYDLLNMEFYLSTPIAKLITCLPENSRQGCILTSRGCPYSCTFCHNSFKNLKYRYNSPKRTVEEMEYLIKNYNLEAIFFIEDNFFFNRARVKEICNLMIERGIKIKWGGNARVDNIDKETLMLAKKAGCIQVTFGWESGSQKMLDNYNKKTTVKQNEDSIRLCNEVGIMANGTVMIGGPDETLEDIELTRDFIVNNFITGGVGICTTTPFPGTVLWNSLEIPNNFNYRDCNFTISPIKMNEIPEHEFYKALNRLRTLAGITVQQSKLNYMKGKI